MQDPEYSNIFFYFVPSETDDYILFFYPSTVLTLIFKNICISRLSFDLKMITLLNMTLPMHLK